MTQETTLQVLTKIESLHSRAAPLRAERDIINAKIEALKTEAKEKTRQIAAIEAPMQELQLDLRRATKLSGREVFTLPAGP